jgi:hypothetical protein
MPRSPRLGARRRRGLALLIGGGVMALAVAAGPLKFYWVPLVSGLTYLAAAAAGGRRGPLWAPGVLVTGWGLVVLARAEGVALEDYRESAVFLVAFGVAAVIAALLARSGFAIDLLGVAVTILAAGLFYLLEQEVDALGNAWTYAALLAAWGAWELRP